MPLGDGARAGLSGGRHGSHRTSGCGFCRNGGCPWTAAIPGLEKLTGRPLAEPAAVTEYASRYCVMVAGPPSDLMNSGLLSTAAPA